MRSVSRSSRNGCMMAMKKVPVLNNRDFKSCLKFSSLTKFLLASSCCLAGYFTWPQVALTHHVCHRCLYAPRAAHVNRRSFKEARSFFKAVSRFLCHAEQILQIDRSGRTV